MYRKIIVADKEYEYVVGRSHTKIKGIGTFLNSEIGKLRDAGGKCECCGTPMSELYPSEDYDRIQVTPADIRAAILKAGI